MDSSSNPPPSLGGGSYSVLRRDRLGGLHQSMREFTGVVKPPVMSRRISVKKRPLALQGEVWKEEVVV